MKSYRELVHHCIMEDTIVSREVRDQERD